VPGARPTRPAGCGSSTPRAGGDGLAPRLRGKSLLQSCNASLLPVAPCTAPRPECCHGPCNRETLAAAYQSLQVGVNRRQSLGPGSPRIVALIAALLLTRRIAALQGKHGLPATAVAAKTTTFLASQRPQRHCRCLASPAWPDTTVDLATQLRGARVLTYV
jgi:hypothetical protein